MSAATATPSATIRTPSRYRVTFGHLVRSEWIKLRSLRSTWWTLAVTVVMMVLTSLLMASQANWFAENPDSGAVLGGAEVIVNSFIFVQLSVAVLGALVITGEYSTGMIRSTLAAAPTRIPALAAKTIVTALVTAVTVTIGLALSYATTAPMLSGNDLVADLQDTTTLRMLGMTIACMTLVSIMSVGFGTIVRHSAGAIFSLVAILFVAPMIGQMFSKDWVLEIMKFMPMNATGYAISATDATGSASLTIAQGGIVMVAWAVVPMIIAGILLKKRDA